MKNTAVLQEGNLFEADFVGKPLREKAGYFCLR